MTQTASSSPRWLLPGGLITVLLSLGAWLACAPGGSDGERAGNDGSAAGAAGDAVIYFPAGSGFLSGERRGLALEEGATTEARVAAIVGAVLAGPQDSGLFPSFPEGIEIGGVFVSPSGTVFVDLNSAELAAPPSTGSHQELLSVYSLVNSILINETSVRRVALLWNGQQRTTLAGHVDLSRPLDLRRSVIADGAAEAPAS